MFWTVRSGVNICSLHLPRVHGHCANPSTRWVTWLVGNRQTWKAYLVEGSEITEGNLLLSAMVMYFNPVGVTRLRMKKKGAVIFFLCCFLIERGLSQLSGLAGQELWEHSCFCPCWDCSCSVTQLAFTWVLGFWTHLCLCTKALYQLSHVYSPGSWFCYSQSCWMW